MVKKLPNIIFLGAPGSGKGTVAQQLVKEYGYQHLSTGDMFRNTTKEDTPFGRKVKALMETGNLISDDITNEMAATYIEKMVKEDKPFILDGYPRTDNQAIYLDNLGEIPFIAIYLDVPIELAIKRIAGRRSCPNCHQVYNTFFVPPQKANICDKCGTELIARRDDNAETAQNRFKIYQKLTQPLIEHYKRKNNLVTIKVRENTNIFEEVKAIIEK